MCPNRRSRSWTAALTLRWRPPNIGFPVVLKPLTLSGSRGVIRADTPESAAAAAARIRRMLHLADGGPSAPLLVERFVPGVEVAVEGLLRRGALDTLAIFDKPDPLVGPYFEETLYVTPSRLPGATQRAVENVTSLAVAGLGLTEGPVHAEVRVNGDEMAVIEVAARSIGGLCARALRFGLGVSLESLILRHALNLPLRDTTATHAASGVMMLPIPAPVCWSMCGDRPRRWTFRASSAWRSRLRGVVGSSRCRKATAILASCSRGAIRRRWSRQRCAAHMRSLR